MRVDFYQLASAAPEGVIGRIAQRLLDDGQRLLVVAADEGALARLDRLLWDDSPASFLPHGVAGGSDDAVQPVLLGTDTVAANNARNLLIADGEWREAALSFDRAFYLFDDATLDGARQAWKLLSGREGVERNYWALDGGKWVKKA